MEAFAATSAFAGFVDPDTDANQNSENNQFSHVFSLLWRFIQRYRDSDAEGLHFGLGTER
jgi:hypothetical protein